MTNVFYVDRWITITQDGGADWQDLAREVADPIRAAPAADSKSAATVAAATAAIAGLSPEDQERLDTINALLDEEVRPYLQNDGGDLHVLGAGRQQAQRSLSGRMRHLSELDHRHTAGVFRIC